jgi:hypothetical protein
MEKITIGLATWAIFPAPLFYLGFLLFGYDYNYIQAYFLSLLLLFPFFIGLLFVHGDD